MVVNLGFDSLSSFACRSATKYRKIMKVMKEELVRKLIDFMNMELYNYRLYNYVMYNIIYRLINSDRVN